MSVPEYILISPFIGQLMGTQKPPSKSVKWSKQVYLKSQPFVCGLHLYLPNSRNISLNEEISL